MYDLPIPEEPDDGSVVLDRESIAWQRQGDEWRRTGVLVPILGIGRPEVAKAWRHLIVDRGPLAPMIAESALEAEGWYRAGYATPEAERFRTPITSREVTETNRAELDTAAIARACATGRQEADRRGFL